MTVFICRTDDLGKIRNIRTMIFNKELRISLNDIFDDDDQKLEQFLIMKNNYIIGTFRLRTENNSYKIERMGILQGFRSKGFGKIALEEIIMYSKKMNKPKIILDSIYTMRDFYAKSGFIQIGNVYSKVGIPHVKMYIHL
ncbi:MAG: GNAT family N-acetyltransferase [Nitrosopumilus sp.]|nr:GNAT family N-acetyltransferase [Nitrosopumilus sp.]MDH3394629.1 GNAT family N-acetyltransferase [Nitrosopumilus sp.]